MKNRTIGDGTLLSAGGDKFSISARVSLMEDTNSINGICTIESTLNAI